MTTNQIIKILQRIVNEHPKAGDKELIITRGNGKRIHLYHSVKSVGWRSCMTGEGQARLSVDFDGTKF